jgi:hypothetical protein
MSNNELCTRNAGSCKYKKSGDSAFCPYCKRQAWLANQKRKQVSEEAKTAGAAERTAHGRMNKAEFNASYWDKINSDVHDTPPTHGKRPDRPSSLVVVQTAAKRPAPHFRRLFVSEDSDISVSPLPHSRPAIITLPVTPLVPIEPVPSDDDDLEDDSVDEAEVGGHEHAMVLHEEHDYGLEMDDGQPMQVVEVGSEHEVSRMGMDDVSHEYKEKMMERFDKEQTAIRVVNYLDSPNVALSMSSQGKIISALKEYTHFLLTDYVQDTIHMAQMLHNNTNERYMRGLSQNKKTLHAKLMLTLKALSMTFHPIIHQDTVTALAKSTRRTSNKLQMVKKKDQPAPIDKLTGEPYTLKAMRLAFAAGLRKMKTELEPRIKGLNKGTKRYPELKLYEKRMLSAFLYLLMMVEVHPLREATAHLMTMDQGLELHRLGYVETGQGKSSSSVRQVGVSLPLKGDTKHLLQFAMLDIRPLLINGGMSTTNPNLLAAKGVRSASTKAFAAVRDLDVNKYYLWCLKEHVDVGPGQKQRKDDTIYKILRPDLTFSPSYLSMRRSNAAKIGAKKFVVRQPTLEQIVRSLFLQENNSLFIDSKGQAHNELGKDFAYITEKIIGKSITPTWFRKFVTASTRDNGEDHAKIVDKACEHTSKTAKSNYNIQDSAKLKADSSKFSAIYQM